MRQAAPLHDIGKIGVPDRVLNKPGKLDQDEWEIMKNHAQIGYQLLHKSDKRVLQLAATISNQHHEKWDGSGYPSGLKQEEIHIAGRIVGLADVLDALVSRRCYKEAWTFEDAIVHVSEQRGKHFDPRLVDLLLERLDEVKVIYQKYPDC